MPTPTTMAETIRMLDDASQLIRAAMPRVSDVDRVDILRRIGLRLARLRRDLATVTGEAIRVTCACGAEFEMSPSLVDWYVSRELSVPSHCPACRETRRQQALGKPADEPKRRGPRSRRREVDSDGIDETPRQTADGLDAIYVRRLTSERAG